VRGRRRKGGRRKRKERGKRKERRRKGRTTGRRKVWRGQLVTWRSAMSPGKALTGGLTRRYYDFRLWNRSIR
jgi:hypothetical protein